MTGAPILTFLGATGTVTGSKFLVESGDTTLLVDCGLYQGEKELRLRNWEPFPVEPSTIDAVVLTHAHVDHCGYLPLLTARGFQGPILASEGTADLAAIVLPDCGHLQEEEAAYANRQGFSKHHPALPLYTETDARACLDQFEPMPFGSSRPVNGAVSVTLHPAGHILGSAIVAVTIAAGGGDRRVVFSGDLGRPVHPILVPPAPIGSADVIVCESTYGGRQHEPEDRTLDRFADAIRRTAKRGGVVLIPAFAVDRTEVLLVHLRHMRERGAIPALPVYVDSPMALAALDIYRDAIERGAVDVRELRSPMGNEPLDPFESRVIEVHTPEDSMELDRLRGPAIIISASGMATGGRVLHHLARYLPDHRSTVVLVGFQAAQTRGRRLADGARELKLLGRYVPVRAEVIDLPAFSVHADHCEVLDWLGTTEGTPDAIYFVHGEPDARAALAAATQDRFGWTTVQPAYRERVRLD